MKGKRALITAGEGGQRPKRVFRLVAAEQPVRDQRMTGLAVLQVDPIAGAAQGAADGRADQPRTDDHGHGLAGRTHAVGSCGGGSACSAAPAAGPSARSVSARAGCGAG